MFKRTALSAIALSAAVLVASSTASFAQYTGPSSSAPAVTAPAPLTSIGAVLKDGKDDQKVTLTGTLKEKVGNEKYTFTDGKDEIRVEIDTEDFPSQKVDDKINIEITGEVEKDYLQTPEIDVDTVKIVK